jgi:hypothetical protein
MKYEQEIMSRRFSNVIIIYSVISEWHFLLQVF